MVEDPDERFAIEGAPEDALRDLLGVDPKETALAKLRSALPAELALPAHQDALIEAARRAGADWDEIKEALQTPR